MKGQGYVNRYSLAFKQKVVQEIETGHLRRAEAARKYGLSSGELVRQWIKRLGKNHLLNKVVRIEMPNEIKSNDIIKGLQKEKQQLESALAQTQIKLIMMESLVEAAKQHLNIDLKKKFGTTLLKSGSKESKS